MARPFNRSRLAHSFCLPEDAADERFVQKIKRVARQFRGKGRAFVLPRDLDLEGCFTAIDQRLIEEEAYLETIGKEFDAATKKARDRYDRLERLTCLRILRIKFIQGARDQPE